MATQKKSRKNVRKKFYEIAIPLTTTKAHLYATNQEDLNGKVVKIDMTRSLRGKGFELKAKVIADEEKLESELISLSLAGSYIRRMMRRGSDYVEDSFSAECRDVIVRIKPFLIARNRISRAVRRALREQAKKFLESHLKTRTAKEIFTDLMTNKIQKQMAGKLKKIYPLALCEVRVFEITGVKEIVSDETEAVSESK